MNNSVLGGSEVIQIADSLAKSMNIPKDSVLDVLEDSIRVAARKKYGNEFSIRAEVDRITGKISLYRDMLVVDDLEIEELPEEQEHLNKILLEEVRFKHPEANLGDVVSDPLPPIDIARIAAQSAKQVLSMGLKEVVREREYDDFISRKGDIINGIVDKVDRGNLLVKVGNSDAWMPRNAQLRTDRFKQGDRIKALLADVVRDTKNPQLQLSRTDNDFIARLFEQEVPEVFDKIIQVKSVARDPGSRAKVAVFTSDSNIDAVGSCVGIRGARVMSVTNELQGEKIDVIEWSSDPATMVINALSTAEVSKVIIDEDSQRIEVVIPVDQLNVAIGRRGQNIRLASQLIGWEVNVISEEDESKRRVDAFESATDKFMKYLDLEEILAQLLVSEGFTEVEEIANAKPDAISSIEGLDEEIAEELIARAQEFLASQNESEGEEQIDAKSEEEQPSEDTAPASEETKLESNTSEEDS